MKDVCLKPLVKHGRCSIMVWGCLTENSVVDLVRIDEIMNAGKYRQILIHHAIPSVKRLLGNDFIFRQDGDPKCNALKIRSYLEQNEKSGSVQVFEITFSKSRFE